MKLRAEGGHSYLLLQTGFFKGRIASNFVSLIASSRKEILDLANIPLLCVRMNMVAFEVRVFYSLSFLPSFCRAPCVFGGASGKN